MINKEDSPSYTDIYYVQMSPSWQRINDLSDGVEKLRNSSYLLKRPLEHDQQYSLRCKEADLFNVFNDTIEGCVGLVFRKEPELADDVDAIIAGVEKEDGTKESEGLWENIDNAGTHGNVFLKQAFDTAVRKGHCVILVENMPPLVGADAAQEKASGRRPYWVKYEPDQVLSSRVIQEAGRSVLQQIVFKECTIEPNGRFGQKEVIRFRVFARSTESGSPSVVWELYEEKKGFDGKTSEVVFLEGGTTGLDEIPVSVIYGQKDGVLKSSPPFEDLVHLNLSHFRKLSDYNQNVSMSQWNLIVRIGAEDTSAPLLIGPAGMIDVKEGGDAKFIETSGSGLTAAREDLQDVEKRMAAIGLSVLVDQGENTKTATEVSVEHAKRTSKLSSMMKSLHDAAELALYFTALYLGIKSGGSIEIGGDLDDAVLDAQTLTVLLNATETGNLTKLTWLKLLAKQVEMPEDFDAQTEADELQGMEEARNAAIIKDAKDAAAGQASGQGA